MSSVVDSLVRVTQDTELDERGELIVEVLVEAFSDLMAADADARHEDALLDGAEAVNADVGTQNAAGDAAA